MPAAGGEIELPYDDLIVAAGVRQSYFGHDEYARWAPGMKTLDDALTIRRRIFGAFEMAETADRPGRAPALAHASRWSAPARPASSWPGRSASWPRDAAQTSSAASIPAEARVLLFDGGEAPLAPFGPKLSAKAATVLDRPRRRAAPGSIVTSSTRTGWWSADPDGASTRTRSAPCCGPPASRRRRSPPLLAEATGAEQDRAGRIEVEPDLTLPGHPEISVVGDVMSLDKLPGVAEVAMQAGYYAARRIRHRGRRAARPAEAVPVPRPGLRGVHRARAGRRLGRPAAAEGRLGWLAWLGIHIAFLTGYRNRFGAVITWAIAFSRERRRERAFTMQQVAPGGADLYRNRTGDEP